MRKQLFILCLLSLFSAKAALAADSAITITGNVKDNACSVSSDSQNFTVNLDISSTKQLFRVGAATPMVPFNIVFDKCGGAAIGLKLGFTGMADTDNTTLLKIDGGSGNAAGMGVQILDDSGSAIPINAASSALSWTSLTAGASKTVSFYARLMATQSPVTPGLVKATANFTLEFQ